MARMLGDGITRYDLRSNTRVEDDDIVPEWAINEALERARIRATLGLFHSDIRRAEAARLRRDGASLKEIGDRFGFTRARAAQLVGKAASLTGRPDRHRP